MASSIVFNFTFSLSLLFILIDFYNILYLFVCVDNPLHVLIQADTECPNTEIKEQADRHYRSTQHIQPIITERTHMGMNSYYRVIINAVNNGIDLVLDISSIKVSNRSLRATTSSSCGASFIHNLK